jgi:hypothetical protein
VPVVNVFQCGRLAELGVPQQALEPLVVAIGLLVLDEQSDEVGVREFGLSSAVETLLQSTGHAEEFQGVERGDGLFIKHDFPPD